MAPSEMILKGMSELTKTSGDVKRYIPGGIRRMFLSPAAIIALNVACNAAVSSVTPSPEAPYVFTLNSKNPLTGMEILSILSCRLSTISWPTWLRVSPVALTVRGFER